MPEAPVYGDKKVLTNPLSAPLANPGMASADAFGAPIAQGASRGIGAAFHGQALRDKAAADAQQERDDFEVLDADNQTVDAVNDLRAKALQVQGKNAIGLNDRTRAEFDKIVAEKSKGLTTPQAKEMFAQRAAQRWNSLDASVVSHSENQIQSFKEATLQGAIDREGMEAIESMDPARIADAERKRFVARQALSSMKGVDLDVEHAKDASNLYASATERFIAAKDWRGAAAFYEANKGKILPSVRDKIGPALKTMENAAKSETYASAIMQDPNQTKSKAYQQLKMIDDPELRRSTMVNVEREFAIREEVKKEEQNSTYEEFADAIDAGESYDSLMAKNPLASGLLTASQSDNLRRVEQNVIQRKEPEEWGEDYTKARNTASQFPEDFATMDLRTLKGMVRKSEYDDLNQRQQAIKAMLNKADDKTPDVTKGFLTIEDQVNNALRAIEINPGSVDGVIDPRATRFRMLMDKKVRAAGGVGKVTPEQVKQFSDELTLEKDFIVPAGPAGRAVRKITAGAAGWFGVGVDGVEKVRAFELPGYDQAAFSVDQVPAADRTKAMQALKAAGVADPTPDEILEWHNGTIAKNAQAP